MRWLVTLVCEVDKRPNPLVVFIKKIAQIKGFSALFSCISVVIKYTCDGFFKVKVLTLKNIMTTKYYIGDSSGEKLSKFINYAWSKISVETDQYNDYIGRHMRRNYIFQLGTIIRFLSTFRWCSGDSS
jgi:hypothetical protein